MRFLFVAILVAGCAHNPGMPRYQNSWPAQLKPAAPPRTTDSVGLIMTTLPWWSIGDETHFVLRFDEQPSPPITGRVLGDVRSGDVDLSEEQFNAIRCAWSLSDTCGGMSIQSAGDIAHDPVSQARGDLKARAGEVGAGVVAQARCFAERPVNTERFRLWCEGVAIVAEAPADLASVDVAAPRTSEVLLPESRFALVADGSVGMMGKQVIVGSSVGFRYRPLEAGFYITDLSRRTIGPQDGGLMGLGLSLLARIQLGHSRADAIAGGSSSLVVQNGSVNENPVRGGMYQGFLGLAYQASWNIEHGQPWVQLRVGGTYGSSAAPRPVPLVELHLGLSTRERR